MEAALILMIVALVVFALSLLAVTAWLLYRYSKKKGVSYFSSSKEAKKKAAVSLPPFFEVPKTYSTTKVQAPIFQQLEPSPPEKRRLVLDHRTSLPENLDYSERWELSTMGSKRTGKVRSSSSPVDASGWHSVPDIPHSSNGSTDEALTPGQASPKLLRPGGADHKRRRISVDVFQHLRAQGRKVSVATMPASSQDPSLDILPMAAAMHRTRTPYEGKKMSDVGSLPPIESDSESGSKSDVEEETFVHQSGAKKRLGMTRRRASEPKTFKKAGKLTFSTEYYPSQGKLEVHIHRAFDIAKRKAHDNIFPFVRLYLLPGKQSKQHTKVQKKTKEPVFNEKKMFHDIPQDELHKHRLKLKVYNRDSVTRNELLGEAELALSSLDIGQRETFSLDLILQATEEANGQIMVSLCHQATFSQLQVIIHKARNLRKVGIMGTPDPYVSVMFCRDNGWEKKDTKAKRNTRNPVYNETFNFDVTTDSSLPLSTFSLVVTVIHKSLVGKDEIIGHVIFGLDSPQPTSTEHWRSITSSPHRLQAEWHSLLDPEEM